MGKLKIIEGNIFNSSCKTLVNTVNCVGVMGKGIALTYKYLYPEMFSKYKDLCDSQLLDIGKLWLYKSNNRWILNFPTKYHWKYPSKIEYLERGLDRFIETYQEKKISSIAFPMLGTLNGGLEEDKVLELMLDKLSLCNIEVEIYKYKPSKNDFLISQLKDKLKKVTSYNLKTQWGLSKGTFDKINLLLQTNETMSVIDLANYKGIGAKTIQKIFNQLEL